MAISRVFGIETEYGLAGTSAYSLLEAYRGRRQTHSNFGPTNASLIAGETDVGGHVGGDYGSLDEQAAAAQGLDAAPEPAGDAPPVGPAQPWRTQIASWCDSIGPTWPTRTSHSSLFPSHSYSCGRDDMLPNGARFYDDMGHPEYSTPETSNPRDLVVADKAGERIVGAAADAVEGAAVYKHNSDGHGTSFGCHENYLMSRVSEEEFRERVVPALVPFFVTRQIFAGSGKVGIEDPDDKPWSTGGHYSASASSSDGGISRSAYERARDRALESLDDLGRHFLDMPSFGDISKVLNRLLEAREAKGEQEVFQLSQRADFIKCLLGLQTTYNRPLVNTRDEPHADRDKYMRLHVICGDANLSEVSTYLKAGTTGLVLDLIEDGLAPRIAVKDPVGAVRRLSCDLSRKWLVDLQGGTQMPAVDIQRQYLAGAQAYRGRDSVTDDVLARWERTLDDLEADPMRLATSLDWAIKLHLLTRLMDRYGAPLTDARIRNAALQYHDINPEAGIYYALQDAGHIERLVTDEEIAHAVHHPPRDTRAYLRGRLVGYPHVSDLDWGGFEADGASRHRVYLDEPLAVTAKIIDPILARSQDAEMLAASLRGVPGVRVTSIPSYSSTPNARKKRKKSKRPFSGGSPYA